MSFATWKEEFYTIPANECPVEDVIEHSLKKWRGLRTENLKKHEINTDSLRNNCFYVNGESCSLCYHFLYETNMEMKCDKCPIKLVTGYECDSEEINEHDSDEFSRGPWWMWIEDSDPEPMIACLERVQKESK